MIGIHVLYRCLFLVYTSSSLPWRCMISMQAGTQQLASNNMTRIQPRGMCWAEFVMRSPGETSEHRQFLFEIGDTCTTYWIPVNEHSNIVKKLHLYAFVDDFRNWLVFCFFSQFTDRISCHFSPWWSPSNSFLSISVSMAIQIDTVASSLHLWSCVFWARGFHCWLMLSDSLRCSLLSGMMIIWYHHIWNYNLYGMWMMTMMSFTFIFGWLDHQSRMRRAATAPSPGSGWF